MGASALAGPFTPGNIVISRVGDGSAALNSNATAVFLDEYTTSGVFVQTVAMPTALSGDNRVFTSSGSATSEGYIVRSSDKASVCLGGYDAVVGTAGVAATASATVNRVIGLVKADGTVDTKTALSDAFDGSNIRSVATVDGTAFWPAGQGGSGKQATAGVRYVPYGIGQTSLQLSADVTNTRCAEIINGQLYLSTGSGTYKGVNTVGTGLPTTSGQTISLLPGFDPNTTSTASPYAFDFAGSTTLYVADDRALTSGGGLQRWDFDAGSGQWILTYTITAGITGTAGIRGVLVVPDAFGNIIYATSGESNANALLKLVDTGAGSSFSVIATAATNTRFRSLCFTPEASATTETLAPTGNTINLGKVSSGDLSSLAADDGNALTVCKFIVPSQTSPIVRMTQTYTTTKPSPTAVELDVKAKLVNAGAFKIRGFQHNYSTSSDDQVIADTTLTLSYATYTGTASGTLTNYVSGGAMQTKVEVQQTGPSTVTAPCVSFEFINLKVTG